MADQRAQPWYERPGPVIGLLAVVLCIGFFLLVVWRTISYVRDFQSGATVALPQFTNAFTPRGVPLTPAQARVVDATSPTAPFLGADDAKVTIVEFGDFACPFSREAYPSLRTIAAEYASSVRYEWRDFPLTTIHPRAHAAAIAASCAGAQKKFWQMHDKLFLNQHALDAQDLANYAAEIGLDTTVFAQCVVSGGDSARLSEDLAAGVAAGVRGTPTFFINGVRVEGAIPYAILKLFIERIGA